MPNYFGPNLKALRNAKGISQAKLGDDLLVDYRTVGAWERQYSEPCFEKLITVAKYFQITIDELLTKELK